MFSTDSFKNLNIPGILKETLAEMSNASLAKTTWSTYQTSLKNLQQFANETNTEITFPLPSETTLAYVGWLLNKGLSAATIDSYISGLMKSHMAAGINPPDLRTPLVTTAIKGKRNLDNSDKRAGRGHSRIPITPNILRHIKQAIKKTEHSSHDKRMLWATCVICFSGGLRCGEVLCKKKNKFDADNNLLHKDLNLKTVTADTEILQVTLRSEKQNKSGTPTICDIYPSKSSLCPVSAYKKWQACGPNRHEHLPAFRWENGSNFTTQELNKFLKKAMRPFLEGTNKTVSGHSLRIGLASCLGHLGFAEQEIMWAGRWSSKAYKSYLQLPRTNR